LVGVDLLDSVKGLKTLLGGYFGHFSLVSCLNVSHVTLYYTDGKGRSVTVNYRIVNKQEGHTKHEYFLEMLDEVKAWGLKPETVTGDSWYAAKETMNTLKDKGFRGLFAPHVNRARLG
jgi:hypothetical protein